MNVMKSEITGHSIVCLTAYADPHKETSKPALLALCEENSPVTGELSAQRASNAEKASISWRHHGHNKAKHNKIMCIFHGM